MPRPNNPISKEATVPDFFGFMRARAVLAAVLLLASTSAMAADGDDALFGLKWGMTVDSVRATGTVLKRETGDANIETFTTKSVPRQLSNADAYLLIFADGKLAKMKYLGNNINGDSFGTEGKEKFETLKSALSEKYGASTNNYQSVGGKLFKESDEFYQCLAYDGCGVWAAVFESPDKSILLELNGMQRGVGYVSLTAEAKPQWSQALERRKTLKGKSDKAAL